MTHDRDPALALSRAMSGVNDKTLGLAVSGGGDSLAMLVLVHNWAKTRGGPDLVALTVDHGLRPESRAEAEFVAKVCAQFGVAHHILTWSGWNRQGNIQDAARKARYNLLAKAALARGIRTVLLAHTVEDQAETVLMALARRAGVDGLAGMAAQKQDRGVTWLRPLLQARRQDLRSLLRDRDLMWVEDPSNSDAKYERVRMRNAQAELAQLGLTSDALSSVAKNAQSARAALEYATDAAIVRVCHPIAGCMRIDQSEFSGLPHELRRRLLARALAQVAPTQSSPRGSSLERVLSQIGRGKGHSLVGCLIKPRRDGVWILRDPAAVKDLETPITALWDGKWRLHGTKTAMAQATTQEMVIRALGENGIKECADWRKTGLPRPAVTSSPAIWHGNRLVAAPIVGHNGAWSAELVLTSEDVVSSTVGY